MGGRLKMTSNCVTRFNPTCTGALHLGHAYTLLVNQWYAKERGGRMLVRFDDAHANKVDGAANVPAVRDEMRRDIEWLGLDVAEWYSEAELEPQVREQMRARGYAGPEYIDPCVTAAFISRPRGWMAYPYQPLLSAERALLDAMMGVTHVIRGEELATDLSLHCWFCDLFGLPIPTFIYLPRLEGARGDISKTAGGYTLAELRANGYTPGDVRALLARGCLVNPPNGWGLENLKAQPRVAV